VNSDVFRILQHTGAFLEGHFQLSSGLHSTGYIQCAKMLQYPVYTEKIGNKIGKHFQHDFIQVVVSPAIGGITIGYEVARRLSVRAIFMERVKGHMKLRRGFSISKGEKALIVEDVITTGASIKELISIIEKAGGEVVGIASIIDRSLSKDYLKNIKRLTLLSIHIPIYGSSSCPLCAKGIPLERPGSNE